MIPAITAAGLTKTFGTVRALDGLDLTVAAGVHGILGPNGAGKTTTLRILLGLLRRDGGRISCRTDGTLGSACGVGASRTVEV
jgi:ABC-2 type transport system ATP-binding protein